MAASLRPFSFTPHPEARDLLLSRSLHQRKRPHKLLDLNVKERPPTKSAAKTGYYSRLKISRKPFLIFSAILIFSNRPK
jgi:hypothetical protein